MAESMEGMSNLARRIDVDGYSAPSHDRVWLPAEAPLAMPRQAIYAPAVDARPSTSPGDIALRRTILFSAAFALSFL